MSRHYWRDKIDDLERTVRRVLRDREEIKDGYVYVPDDDLEVIANILHDAKDVAALKDRVDELTEQRELLLKDHFERMK